ncbi:nucleotide-sugar transporter-domain-containing protein [Aspergillus spectabilis]
MPHKSFHIPLRTSSVNAPTGEMNNNRKANNSRSIHKAQKILGTTDIALDHDYHRRPEESTNRRASFLNAPELAVAHHHDIAEDGLHSQHLRVRASSPLLGQEYRDTVESTPPLVQLSRKLHLSGSSSALYSRYTSRESPAKSRTIIPDQYAATEGNGQNVDGGLNPAFKQPKGPMKDSKRKTRPPRIDLSMLFPKPHTTATPLLSPQRMMSSPSAISITSENSTLKMRKSDNRLPAKKLTKAPPRPRALSRPEDNQQTLDGVLSSSITHGAPGPVWGNSSIERTVRTSEMDLALENTLEALPTSRSIDRVQYSPMNFSLRSRDQLQRSDSKSFVSARSGQSASSQQTLREAPSTKSLKDGPTYSPAQFRFGLRDHTTRDTGPMISKKSSKSTLKNSDLNTSSVLCLSSSEDEDDDPQPFKSHLKLGKNKRDSVSTYGDFEAEICTAAAAQTTRGTLRSVERPSSSSNTQSSRTSSKPAQPRRDSSVSVARTPSSVNRNTRARRSSGVPAILEPDFLHNDPIFDQTKVRTKTPTRTPTLSQKEINRRSRLIAVTRQEERLLEVMRQRQGKITPSLFNEAAEPDRRSVISGVSRDSYYCTDTSFLRLSPGVPSPALARALKAPNQKDKGMGSDSEEKASNSASSRRASLASSKSLPSPATSATSPLTPTLPIHRFSPLPTQKPPPRRPPPPVPPLQRQHSRRRTDSSGVIALDDGADDRKDSTEFPIWALGWNTESGNITAAINMGDRVQRQSSKPGAAWKHTSWILLTVQYTTYVLLAHYSRIMPPTGGKRYLTSTAVFFSEVVKLGVSLTLALYEVSKSAPPSVAATSLLSSLAAAVFSGDSWKLAIPASLHTISSSLQYIALSNLQPATFQVSYQIKIVVSSIFGLVLLKRSIPLRKCGLLLLLVVGVGLVLFPHSSSDEPENAAAHLDFPRSLEEWKSVKMEGRSFQKRSATYEGIEDDILTATPRFNEALGIFATLGACAASGLSGVYFEKVLWDSAKTTSLWVRNVQLSVYSIFPALFIGVVFLDGEKIANGGIFDGYNWVVVSTILVHAIGGLAASFYAVSAHADTRNVASATTVIFTSLGSVWLFEFEPTITHIIGTFAVLVAIYLCEAPSSDPKRQGLRPAPIRVDRFQKESKSDQTSPVSSSPKEISIKLPTTPFLSEAGLSTSRPASPSVTRANAPRTGGGGYF